MPRITLGTVVKLVLASLAVGIVLAMLNVTPQDFLSNVVERARAAFEWAAANVGEAVSLVLVGAVIVVPIWLLVYIAKALKQRK